MTAVCKHPEKAAYASEEAAERSLARLQERDWSGYRGLRAYQCKCGKHWHLGHPAPTLNKRINIALNGGQSR